MTDLKDLPDDLFDFNRNDYIKTLPKRLPIKKGVSFYPHPEDPTKELVVVKYDNGIENCEFWPANMVDEHGTLEVTWACTGEADYYCYFNFGMNLGPESVCEVPETRHPNRIQYNHFYFAARDKTKLLSVTKEQWFLDLILYRAELEANLKEVTRVLEEWQQKII